MTIDDTQAAKHVAVPVRQLRSIGTLGASRAAAVLGLDPYTSPLDVWLEMRGELANDRRNDAVREAADWGQALEPVIRGKYALDRKVNVLVPTRSLVRDEWLSCTPDGVVMKQVAVPEEWSVEGGITHAASDSTMDFLERHPDLMGDGLVQVKTASAYQRDTWTLGVPERYEIQVRVEMLVTRLPWCDVVCLVGGQKLYVHRVMRDESMEERLYNDLGAFWASVRDGKEPSVDASQAWRDRAAARMKKTTAIMETTRGDELNNLILQWKTCRDDRRRAKREEEMYKTGILLRMSAAGATGVQDIRGRVTAYQTGGRTDWKGIAVELASESPAMEEKMKALRDQHTKPANTWTLRAPKEWSDDDEE